MSEPKLPLKKLQTYTVGHGSGRLSFEKSDLSSSAEDTHQHGTARRYDTYRMVNSSGLYLVVW